MKEIIKMFGSRGVTASVFSGTASETLAVWKAQVENLRNLGYLTEEGRRRYPSGAKLDEYVSAVDADTGRDEGYAHSSIFLLPLSGEVAGLLRLLLPRGGYHEPPFSLQQVAVYVTCSRRAFFWAGPQPQENDDSHSKMALIGFATLDSEGSETAYEDYFLGPIEALKLERNIEEFSKLFNAAVDHLRFTQDDLQLAGPALQVNGEVGFQLTVAQDPTEIDIELASYLEASGITRDGVIFGDFSEEHARFIADAIDEWYAQPA